MDLLQVLVKDYDPDAEVDITVRVKDWTSLITAQQSMSIAIGRRATAPGTDPLKGAILSMYARVSNRLLQNLLDAAIATSRPPMAEILLGDNDERMQTVTVKADTIVMLFFTLNEVRKMALEGNRVLEAPNASAFERLFEACDAFLPQISTITHAFEEN
jgi:hypothetical protein